MFPKLNRPANAAEAGLPPPIPAIPHVRREWVKAQYAARGPNRESVVCQLYPDSRIAYHRTSQSQWYARAGSPGGIDVGAIRYLEGLATLDWFIIHYKDAPAGELSYFVCPWSAIQAQYAAGDYSTVMQGSGEKRTRVFVPIRLWSSRVEPSHRSPFEVIPNKDETRLDGDTGNVLWRTRA